MAGSSLALAAVLVCTMHKAYGNSLGLGVPICDAYDDLIWKPLDQGGKYMWWTAAPQHTSEFTLRSGDGAPSADRKSYTPGELLYIHVRSHKLGHKYRGLLLYAKDSKGQKVGSWELPPEDKVLFHTPSGSCGGKGVFHSGADEKNYHNVFPFRAPAKSTGPITFEALLKLGPANTGYFAWPNTAKLTLQESSMAPAQQLWFKGGAGESCTATCKNLGGSCFAEGFTSVNSPKSLQSAIRKNYACKLPFLKGCASSSPSEATRDAFCSYQGCTDTGAKPSCASTDNSAMRFCPCKGVSAAVLAEVRELEAIQQPEESEDEWTELGAENTAKMGAEVPTKAGCASLASKRACKLAGCVFIEEEGLQICSESELPI